MSAILEAIDKELKRKFAVTKIVEAATGKEMSPLPHDEEMPHLILEMLGEALKLKRIKSIGEGKFLADCLEYHIYYEVTDIE